MSRIPPLLISPLWASSPPPVALHCLWPGTPPPCQGASIWTGPPQRSGSPVMRMAPYPVEPFRPAGNGRKVYHAWFSRPLTHYSSHREGKIVNRKTGPSTGRALHTRCVVAAIDRYGIPARGDRPRRLRSVGGALRRRRHRRTGLAIRHRTTARPAVGRSIGKEVPRRHRLTSLVLRYRPAQPRPLRQRLLASAERFCSLRRTGSSTSSIRNGF